LELPKNEHVNGECCTIRIKLSKDEVQDILCGYGVQQGDNVAPILLIYAIWAAFETLQKLIWDKKSEFRYFPD